MSTYGIDYSFGGSNVDFTNGIHYGVISVNDVTYWYDEAKSDYGDATCPECGKGAVEDVEDDSDYKPLNGRGTAADWNCLDCKVYFDSDSAFPESPVNYSTGGDIRASQSGEDSDVFITKSPYFTYAQFCSPCAPGACYLLNQVDTAGPRAYCLSVDYFEDGLAPYDIYDLQTGRLVYSTPRD